MAEQDRPRVLQQRPLVRLGRGRLRLGRRYAGRRLDARGKVCECGRRLAKVGGEGGVLKGGDGRRAVTIDGVGAAARLGGRRREGFGLLKLALL